LIPNSATIGTRANEIAKAFHNCSAVARRSQNVVRVWVSETGISFTRHGMIRVCANQQVQIVRNNIAEARRCWYVVDGSYDKCIGIKAAVIASASASAAYWYV